MDDSPIASAPLRPTYTVTIAPEVLESRAEWMRDNPTLWERLLAKILSDETQCRYLFQVPLGNRYIVDFLCTKHRTVVEADGAQHYDPIQLDHDRERDRFLRSLGYTVVRLRNRTIQYDPVRVRRRVRRACKRAGVTDARHLDPPDFGYETKAQQFARRLAARLGKPNPQAAPRSSRRRRKSKRS